MADDVLPTIRFHDRFSVADQRADGRDIDGLTAVDAGLYGKQQRLGLGELGRPRLDGFELGIDQAGKIERAAVAELPDLGEREARLLEREDLADPIQLAGAVIAPPGR